MQSLRRGKKLTREDDGRLLERSILRCTCDPLKFARRRTYKSNFFGEPTPTGGAGGVRVEQRHTSFDQEPYGSNLLCNYL